MFSLSINCILLMTDLVLLGSFDQLKNPVDKVVMLSTTHSKHFKKHQSSLYSLPEKSLWALFG